MREGKEMETKITTSSYRRKIRSPAAVSAQVSGRKACYIITTDEVFRSKSGDLAPSAFQNVKIGFPSDAKLLFLSV